MGYKIRSNKLIISKKRIYINILKKKNMLLKDIILILTTQKPKKL